MVSVGFFSTNTYVFAGIVNDEIVPTVFATVMTAALIAHTYTIGDVYTVFAVVREICWFDALMMFIKHSSLVRCLD